MPRIVILTTGDPLAAAQHAGGTFADMIESAVGPVDHLGFLRCDVRLQQPPSPTSLDGAIITGSSHSVYERVSWMLDLATYIRQIVALAKPLLGLCFGHQAIADALGGEISANPRGRELGRTSAEPLRFDHYFPPDGYSVLMAHQDTVTRCPAGAVILARTARDRHAALRFAQNCWGVQFHPEFSPDVVRAYVEHRRAELLAQGDDPSRILSELAPTPAAAAILRKFCWGIPLASASNLARGSHPTLGGTP